MFAIVNMDGAFMALGSAVLQFLWQGVLIGAATWVALAFVRGRSPAQRHAIAYAALVASLLAFLFAFASALRVAPAELSVALPNFEPGAPSVARVAPSRVAAWTWIVGVACMALRWLRQYRGVRRLVRSARPVADPSWSARFEELQRRIGLPTGLRLLQSGLAEVPMVVGWLSPVVLVPLSAFSGMDPLHLRALLAHELAHLRRHDPWLNALQTAIEGLLFFHPVVWWISRIVRVEREYCCDDLSIQVTGDARLLAVALAEMETLRSQSTSQLAAHGAALGANGGPLMTRIQRILGTGKTQRSTGAWQVPAGLLVLASLAVVGGVHATPQNGGEKVVEGVHVVEVRERQIALLEEHLHALQLEQHRLSLELDQLVAEGKMSAAEAKKRIDAWSNGEQARRAKDLKSKLFWSRLKSDVDSGRISKEEAYSRKLEHEELFAKPKAKPSSEDFIRKILTAVEQGQLTPEEGQAKVRALQEKLTAERAAERQRYERQLAIRERALAGELSKEAARRELAALQETRAKDQVLLQRKDLEASIAKTEALIHEAQSRVELGQAKLAELRAKLRQMEGER